MSEVTKELLNQFTVDIDEIKDQIDRYKFYISECYKSIRNHEEKISKLREKETILKNLIKNLENSEDEES